MSFVHLHTHSEYSLLDGASRIDAMFARARSLEMPALALTDHGAMYGAVPFWLAGEAHKINPIIGMEGYVAPKSRFDPPASRADYFHITLLSATNEGYSNLLKLTTLGYMEGYDSRSRKPRIDRELLAKHSDGLVVLSGCLSSEVDKAIMAGRLDVARNVAGDFKEIFGDRYFLELQNQGVGPQAGVNEELARIGAELKIPLVATNDSHYTAKEDAAAHDILLCIQTGSELAATDRLRFDTDEFYLKDRKEMMAAFTEYPEAVDNTLMVAEQCGVDLDLHQLILPHFEVPEGKTLETHLREETEIGLKRRYGNRIGDVQGRASHELDAIEKMGFSGYFLIVADFVGWAKKSGIRVGPGRGSVGGSIVAYALGITELDPIRWKLPFERFLNPGRKQLPDIDIDFDDRRRGEVIRYVSEKYGEDRVAQIITFSSIKAKQAIRDAARVLGLPYGVGDRLAKMFPPLVLGKEAPFAACFDEKVEWPHGSGKNDAYSGAADLRKAFDEDQVARDVIEAARKLEGLRRQHSIHAAGVVIGREPLVNHVPLQRTEADGEVVTQYEMNAIEAIGLLKIDFLGLRNLTILEDTLEHIRNNLGKEVDIDGVALDDPRVFELLREGTSAGIFQMESPGMVRLLRSLRPDRFEEIAALIALYRPGPMDEIGRYVKGKHEPAAITYYHPLLEKVLADTNGVIVYQEQITEILQVVAGFDAQKADLVRYAIGKKKSKELAKHKTSFLEGCSATGLTEREAEGLWDLIRPFAGYSFNRAHANGYGLISYQTAWLKAHFPVEYMAGLLTSVKDKQDRMPLYLAECRDLKIKVQPPDVNTSNMDFTPKGKEILFGLSAIRNVGEAVAERIIRARASGGAFQNFEDFLKRVDPTALNKKVIESLSKAGAFDRLNLPRAALLERAEEGLALSGQTTRLVEAIVAERRSEDAGQYSLFAQKEGVKAASNSGAFNGELKPVGELNRSEELAAEKQMLGFYVSEHPLESVEASLSFQAEIGVAQIAESAEGAVRTVGGILSRVTKKFTKKGELMLIATLEDMKASVEVVFFPQTVKSASPALLSDDSIVLVKGRVDTRDDPPKLIASAVKAPDLSASSRPLRIQLPAASCTPDRIGELKSVFRAHPGPSPVLLHLTSERKTTVLRLGGDYRVELRGGLFAEVKSLLGAKAVLDEWTPREQARVGAN